MCLVQGDSPTGKILKRQGYTEVKVVGEGAHGRAVLVEDEHGDRLVCKLIDVGEASPEEVDTVTKEAKLLASMKHPYVVKYHSTFTDSGWYGIVMDFCEGGELAEQIRNRRDDGETPFPEEQILRWITQAALALKHVHGKRILHRDLKPANFFLSKDGRNLRLGDFGIAQTLGITKAWAKTLIGTPYYLSPEAVLGKRYRWPADIWSLGCILYELCALKVPFSSQNMPVLMHRIVNGTLPEVPGHYSDFTRQLCADMMNRDPKARPSAAKILQYPQIQQVMKEMLREAQELRGQGLGPAPPLQLDAPEAEALQPKGAPPPPPSPIPPVPDKPAAVLDDVTPVPPAAAGMAAVPPDATTPSSDGAYRSPCSRATSKEGSDCRYKVGDHVELCSSVKGVGILEEWVPSVVIEADHEGRLLVGDGLRGEWLNRDEQISRVRPRAHSEGNGRSARPLHRPSAPPAGTLRRPRRAASHGPLKQAGGWSPSCSPTRVVLPALSKCPPYGAGAFHSPAAAGAVVTRSVPVELRQRRSARSIDNCTGPPTLSSPAASRSPCSCPALMVDSQDSSRSPKWAESPGCSKDTFGGAGVVRRLPRLGLGDPFCRPSLVAAAALMIAGV